MIPLPRADLASGPAVPSTTSRLRSASSPAQSSTTSTPLLPLGPGPHLLFVGFTLSLCLGTRRRGTLRVSVDSPAPPFVSCSGFVSFFRPAFLVCCFCLLFFLHNQSSSFPGRGVLRRGSIVRTGPSNPSLSSLRQAALRGGRHFFCPRLVDLR